MKLHKTYEVLWTSFQNSVILKWGDTSFITRKGATHPIESTPKTTLSKNLPSKKFTVPRLIKVYKNQTNLSKTCTAYSALTNYFDFCRLLQVIVLTVHSVNSN